MYYYYYSDIIIVAPLCLIAEMWVLLDRSVTLTTKTLLELCISDPVFMLYILRALFLCLFG